MFKVGDLVIDYQDDIGVIVRHIHEDLWKVHYLNGTGEGDMWLTELRLLCSK